MKMKIYIIFFILALVFIAACTSQQKTTTNSIYTPNEQDTQINNPPVDNSPSSQVPVPDNEDIDEMIVDDDIIENAEVEIEDFKYNPSTITIKKGATVTFKQRDSIKHTVTSDNNLFDSGLLSKDEEWSYTFNEAGVFEYYCKPHPYMKGKIIVE